MGRAMWAQGGEPERDRKREKERDGRVKGVRLRHGGVLCGP